MFHIILSVFCYDIWFYVSHRLLHTKTMYPIHNIHHRYVVSTLWDTYEGHKGLGTFVPFLYFSYDWTAILTILFILNVRGLMRHDERFVWLIGNHHLLHHRFPQYNFGEYWLDRLGGTLYPNRKEAVSGILYM